MYSITDKNDPLNHTFGEMCRQLINSVLIMYKNSQSFIDNSESLYLLMNW